MPRKNHPTVQVGDLVTAAFDAAAQLGGNSREVARLATVAVAHLLRRSRPSPALRGAH